MRIVLIALFFFHFLNSPVKSILYQNKIINLFYIRIKQSIKSLPPTFLSTENELSESFLEIVSSAHPKKIIELPMGNSSILIFYKGMQLSNCLERKQSVYIEDMESPKPGFDPCESSNIFFSLKSEYNAPKAPRNLKFDDHCLVDTFSKEDQGHKSQKSSNKNQKLPKALKKSISSSNMRKSSHPKSKSRIVDIFQKSLKSSNFICGICQEQCAQSQKLSIGTCHHFFCSPCLQSYIIIKADNFSNVYCPETDCSQVLSADSLLGKSLPAQIQKKLNKINRFYDIVKNPSLKLCPKQKCQNGIIRIPEAWFTQPQDYKGISVSCNQCKTKYCLKCFQAEHSGSCRGQQNLFSEFNRYRRCQLCRNVIQKGKGCSHMTCRCGYQFCFLCGAEWQKKGHACKYLEQQLKRQREEQKMKYIEESKCANRCFSVIKIIFKVVFFIPLWALALCFLVPKILLKICLFSIIALTWGATFYTCIYIYKRQNKKMRILLAFLYPLTMFVGIGLAFIHLFSMFVLVDFSELKKITHIMLFW